jgi:hypothetical protein
MTRLDTARDLFGKPVRSQRPRYEVSLERGDKRTLPDRAARVRWLSGVIPTNLMFGMPLETLLVFQEAKSSFIYGNFVAAIVMASSFVEHWLSASLDERGYQKEASRGLASSIKCARANNLVAPLLLDKADRLRLIRNPFAHLKSFDHEHSLNQRLMRKRAHPAALLEADAQEALITMYGIAIYAFARH